MTEAISNIWRRPLRTALTILGIVIGVFALTVMGALAEKLNVLVDGGDEYFRTRIFVFDEGAASGFQASARPITRDLVDEMTGLEGVDRATPVLQTLLDPDEVGGFDIPELLTGIEPETWYDERVDLRIDAGRFLEAGEESVTVIGADLAERYDLRVGDSFTMRERDFEVVGVLERVRSSMDGWYVGRIPHAAVSGPSDGAEVASDDTKG
ncbi:MAG: ABC transporter permease, partial [Chloroflexota bacterium]|nr:ABC transporter permease [Chloroflexota bacterium]